MPNCFVKSISEQRIAKTENLCRIISIPTKSIIPRECAYTKRIQEMPQYSQKLQKNHGHSQEDTAQIPCKFQNIEYQYVHSP